MVGAVELLPLATNPKTVEPLPDRVPLYAAFFTLTVPLLPVAEPFHRLLMLCPLARTIATVQPLSVDDPLFSTVTSAWNPLLQLLTSLYVALHAPV